MDEYTKKLKEWYNKTASKYDSWGEEDGQYTSNSRNKEICMFNNLLDQISIDSSTQILDIATGTGIYLVEALKRGGTGTGIDISENMLKELRGKLNRLNLNKQVKSLIVADAFSLKLKDNSFDLIICIGLFDYYDFPDVSILVGEMKRVGKPASYFIIDFPNKNNARTYEFKAAEILVGHEVYVHEPEEIKRFLEKSGFEIIMSNVADTEIQFLLKNK